MKLVMSAFAFCLLVIGFHMWGPSYYNNNIWPSQLDEINRNDMMTEHHESHLSWRVYKKRILTSHYIEVLRPLLPLELRDTFLWGQFLFVFLFLVALIFVQQRLGIPVSDSVFTQIFFSLSLPTCFMFFTPLASYDEPIGYFLFIVSMLMVLRKDRILALFFLSLTVICRESFFLLVPGLLILAAQEFNLKKIIVNNWKDSFLYTIVPLGIYIFYLQFVYRYDMPDRFSKHLSRNWGSIGASIQSLLSMYLVLAFPVCLAVYAYVFRRKENERMFLDAFSVTCLINLVVVFICTIAKESRLFFPPVIFILPYMGSWMKDLWTKMKTNKVWADKWWLMGSFLILATWFVPSPQGGAVVSLYKSYLIFYSIAVWAIILTLKTLWNTRRT